MGDQIKILSFREHELEMLASILIKCNSHEQLTGEESDFAEDLYMNIALKLI